MRVHVWNEAAGPNSRPAPAKSYKGRDPDAIRTFGDFGAPETRRDEAPDRAGYKRAVGYPFELYSEQ